MDSHLEVPGTIEGCDKHLAVATAELAQARADGADVRIAFLLGVIDTTLKQRYTLMHPAALAAAGARC